jgi:hypothetical protein
MNKTIVIYHNADFDGIFCREIARKFLPEAELIGWNYGDPTPEVPLDCTLYILDLSVPDLMNHPRLIWIDHHKTAIDKYPATIPGYRIDGVGACRLAWQWFTHDHYDFAVQCTGLPGKEAFVDRKVTEPLSVRLAGEYDIWDKRDPNADLFQHGLRAQEITPQLWAELFWTTGAAAWLVNEMLKRGQAIAYVKTEENKSIIGNNGFTIRWEGLCLLACNASKYNSDLFTAGIQPEHEGLLGFCLRANGRWSVSLYGVPGKPDVDLSAIASKYGGGGHKQACGFACDVLPFITLYRC